MGKRQQKRESRVCNDRTTAEQRLPDFPKNKIYRHPYKGGYLWVIAETPIAALGYVAVVTGVWEEPELT